MTVLLKEAEKGLKQLRQSDKEKSASQEQIKQNIICILAGKLRELTMRFKQNEKEHYIKVKDFHGDDDVA